jgi:hypothetical protein
MVRFSSLKYVPAETRRILRDRLARYLPVSAVSPLIGGNFIPDEQLFNLLLNFDIASEMDLDRARATYNAALPVGGAEPTFEEVTTEGRLRIVLGRVTTPFEVDQRASAAPDRTLTALAALLSSRFGERFTFQAAIERGDVMPESLRSRSPEWVAARLWDRGLSDLAMHSAELRSWIDRWRLLGRPSLVAHKVWSETDADAFRESALAALETEPGLSGWEETRANFIRQISLRSGQAPAVAARHVPISPASLFERVRWLKNLWPEGAIAGVVAANPDLAGLVQLLLTDVEERESAAAPHPTFKRLMDLAVVRKRSGTQQGSRATNDVFGSARSIVLFE